MTNVCDDNRFELIKKYKQALIESTNIEMSPDEMAVIDNILFRFWQMGWLDKLERPTIEPDHFANTKQPNLQQTCNKLATDCISRQAAIDAISCDITVTGRQNAELVAATIGTFADRIKALPSAQPEWIPCSERLPENDCQCIVTAKVKHVDGYPDYEVDTADYTDGIFTTANSWWGVESIIAWMPLPEPYKERREE